MNNIFICDALYCAFACASECESKSNEYKKTFSRHFLILGCLILGPYFYIFYRAVGHICVVIVVVVMLLLTLHIGECCEGTQRPFRVLRSIAAKYN